MMTSNYPEWPAVDVTAEFLNSKNSCKTLLFNDSEISLKIAQSATRASNDVFGTISPMYKHCSHAYPSCIRMNLSRGTRIKVTQDGV